MPLSASVGETADGQPNTESSFLSTHYLQNHGLGTRPLEGHLSHSPMSRTICTKIVLVTQLPISLTQKSSPDKELSVSAQLWIPRTLSPSIGKCSLKTKFLRIFFFISLWTSVPRWCRLSQICVAPWVLPGRCAPAPYSFLTEYQLDGKTRILIPRLFFYKSLKRQLKSFKRLHDYFKFVYVRLKLSFLFESSQLYFYPCVSGLLCYITVSCAWKWSFFLPRKGSAPS